MIFVLMTSRSGSSMVCKLLAEHGLKWRDPTCPEPRQRAANGRAGYETYENRPLKNTLKAIASAGGEGWPHCRFWAPTTPDIDLFDRWWDSQDIEFAKMAVEFAPLATAWAARGGHDMKFLKVMRDPVAVADSHTTRFRRDWEEAFDYACRRYELMDQLPGECVYTDELAELDWFGSNIRKALASVGVAFNEAAARRAIDVRKFTKSKRSA